MSHDFEGVCFLMFRRDLRYREFEGIIIQGLGNLSLRCRTYRRTYEMMFELRDGLDMEKFMI